MGKDIRLAMDSLQGGTAPLGQVLDQIYRQGINTLGGDEDFIGLIRMLQNPAPLGDRTEK
jgi:hypothetical protein